MPDLELAVIGAQVELPSPAAFRSSLVEPVRADRLTDLATWWAGVAGTAPPRQIVHLWPSVADVDVPSTARVSTTSYGSPADVPDALALGVATADEAVDDGADLLLLTIPEERDWEILAAHLLDLDAVEAMGWPTARGLSDVAWIAQVAGIRDGLRRVRGIRNEPENLLATLGNPALAAGTALLLQAVSRRTPVLLDGPGAAVCALLAHRISRPSRSWLQAADGGVDPLHTRVLGELRLTPLTQLSLTDPSGVGGRLGLLLLETAIERALSMNVTAEDDSDLDDLI